MLDSAALLSPVGVAEFIDMLGDERFPNTPQYVLALSPPSSPPTADPAAAKPILHLHNLLRKNGTELKALQRDPSSADVVLSTREKLIEYLIAKMNTPRTRPRLASRAWRRARCGPRGS